MKWVKKGLLIIPQKKYPWMKTHCMTPLVDNLKENNFRIYFSGRDNHSRSVISFANVIIKNQKVEVLNYGHKPVLNIGDLGCFDDNGVLPSSIVNFQNKKYLYYIGWNKRSVVRMSLMIGLAVSKDGGKSFVRFSKAPILERTDKEPYTLITAPWVIRENNFWQMWYVSGVKWVNPDLPRYNIRYAESKDGVFWQREGRICINFKSSRENALARPCVLKENNLYKMWYSHKGENYVLGYAESKDGLNWQRKDEEIGIKPSSAGWDSQMIEYGLVLQHKGTKYLFYNGNNYGKNGIGYAVEREK